MDQVTEISAISSKDADLGPKDVPFLILDQYAPKLEHGRMQDLLDQWKLFWKVRNRGENAPLLTNIPEGAFVHNGSLFDDLLPTVLESGILSGELGYGRKQTIPEDSETHFCADFFVNFEDRSVSEYQKYINEMNPEFASRKIYTKRGENYSSPGARNNNVAFVIDSKQEQLQQLLEFSTTGDNPDKLSAFGVRFPHAKNNHGAVLVGIPANAIGMMIVGEKISTDPEKIFKIKTEIANHGLNFPIVDIAGNTL